VSHEGDIFLRISAAIGSGRSLVFIGEMQLAGWQDSHNGGSKVTLWLPDAEALECFRDLTARKGKMAGQRLAVVMMEVLDDESFGSTPAAPKASEPVGRAQPVVEPSGPACAWLVIRCREPVFQTWLAHIYPALWLKHDFQNAEPRARKVVLDLLQVNSRKDVDGDELALRRFNHLRVAYAKHLESRVV